MLHPTQAFIKAFIGNVSYRHLLQAVLALEKYCYSQTPSCPEDARRRLAVCTTLWPSANSSPIHAHISTILLLVAEKKTKNQLSV